MSKDKILDELAWLAKESAEAVEHQFDNVARPHLQRILYESALVATRAAAGEDVQTATTALQSSIANLAREQQALVILEGRSIALRAAMIVISALVGR